MYISNIYAHISASQISNILEMCLHWETRIPRVSDNLSGPQPSRSGASVHLYLSPQTAWFLPGPLSDTARWSCRLRRAVGVTATGIGSDSGANLGAWCTASPGWPSWTPALNCHTLSLINPRSEKNGQVWGKGVEIWTFVQMCQSAIICAVPAIQVNPLKLLCVTTMCKYVFH